MSLSTADLRKSVIEAGLQAAGIRDVRVLITADGGCVMAGCVNGLEQEALVRRLIENAGIDQISGELTHVSEIGTEVDVRVHKVEKGESWWAIAVRYYGDGRHHVALREANGSPKTIVVGDVVVIPKLD